MSGQEGLFGDMIANDEERHERPLPVLPEWPIREKLTGEKEMLGFYVTGHPLDHYQEKITELASHTTSNLEGLAKGVEVALCGILTNIQRKRNREAKPWVAFQIEDREGAVDGMVFTTNYDRLSPAVVEDEPVLVRGLVLPEENAPPKISVQEIVPLEVARTPMPSLISIRVWLGRNGGVDRAAELRDLFQNKPGETQVRLRLESARDFSVILDVPVKVRPDKEFRARLAQMFGNDAFEVLAG